MLGRPNSLLLALHKDMGLCETRGESSESGRSGKSAWCWWLVRRWLGTPRDGRTCTDTIPSPFTLFFLDFWKVLLLSEPRFLEMLIKLEQNSMRRLRGITSAFGNPGVAHVVVHSSIQLLSLSLFHSALPLAALWSGECSCKADQVHPVLNPSHPHPSHPGDCLCLLRGPE